MPFVERARLNALHERTKVGVMNDFRSRLQRSHAGDKKRRDSYANQLSTDIDRLYDSYVRENGAKVVLFHGDRWTREGGGAKYRIRC